MDILWKRKSGCVARQGQLNCYQDPNSATPRSRQGMGRSMSPSLTISRVTVAPTGSSSAMVRNPLMVIVAPSARDTGKGTTCRPIRGEHCCHVTSSPPITAHLGRVEGAWLGAARAEAVLEVVQLEDGGGGGQGEAGGQQQHLHPYKQLSTFSQKLVCCHTMFVNI